MLANLMNIINYDVKLYARKGGELTTLLGFVAIAAALFPFAQGAGADYALTAPAYIWIIALLASLLSIPHIFHRDHADGTLDQIRLSGITLEWCVLAKSLANWIGCQLPLVFLSPLVGLMLGMEEGAIGRLTLSLLITTPLLCCIGALGSALTLYASNKTNVLAVIVLPLYIPALIFATSLAQSDASVAALDLPQTLALLGMLMAAVPLSCWASAAILRLQD